MNIHRSGRLSTTAWLVLACVIAPGRRAIEAQQIADPDFKPTVEQPAYVSVHPLVVLDEAHANFHTASGRYKPFVSLLEADGYRVIAGTNPFTGAGLRDARVLVIANAGSGTAAANIDPPTSAFTDAECDAVRDWVKAGGSLLLIADHAPFGAAAEALAARFGVEMGKGYAWIVDSNKQEPTSTIEYSVENGLLGTHPITRGVSRVVAFTGQSLSIPPGATALLKFGSASYESSGTNMRADFTAFREGKPTTAPNISGRAQGIALDYGKGRVVIMGEAGMFSAQVGRFKDEKGQQSEFKMGMNVPGNDNARFLLNILHWLTRLEE